MAEFRTIVDHRSVALCDPIGALARMELGRAYALSGNQTDAVSAYSGLPTALEGCGPGNSHLAAGSRGRSKTPLTGSAIPSNHKCLLSRNRSCKIAPDEPACVS